MNPLKQARGVERGRGGKPADDHHRDPDCNTMPSTVSEASSKRKYEHDSNNDDLFKMETDDKVSVSNRNNKALTRSSPSGRQPKREN